MKKTGLTFLVLFFESPPKTPFFRNLKNRDISVGSCLINY